MKESLTTIILAGGKSSRMGQDKALLTYQGTTLLTRTCHLALTLACSVYVVTPWGDRYQAHIPPGCILLPEVWPEKGLTAPGPLWAFAQVLPHLSTDWVLLLACDLPRLTANFLQSSYQQLAQVSPQALAYISRGTQGWEPLCGFYRVSGLETLQSFIAQGGRGFQGWLNQIEVAELTLADPQLLFNCNNPQDWQSLATGQKRR